MGRDYGCIAAIWIVTLVALAGLFWVIARMGETNHREAQAWCDSTMSIAHDAHDTLVARVACRQAHAQVDAESDRAATAVLIGVAAGAAGTAAANSGVRR